MHRSHRKILHSIFAHPLPTNLYLRDVEGLLRELGAEIGHTSHGRFSATLNGQQVTIHGGNHGLSKDEVAQLRKTLEAAGIAPMTYPV